jgi:hypothetical protein
MSKITEKGRLQYGIQFGGKWHYDFEVRVPTVEDNINAIEVHGTGSGMRVSFAMMVSAITELGDIPKDKITFDLLSKNLVDNDFDALNEALLRVKKKRELMNPDLKNTKQENSSLAATE